MAPASGWTNERTVSWYASHFPPWFIFEGPLHGQGIADIALRSIFDQLDDLEHRIVPANMKRALAELKNQDRACQPAAIRTPDRENYLTFSHPYMIGHGNGLVVRSEDIPKLETYLDKNGLLDLRKYLQSETNTLGLSLGRSFGPEIDDIITNASQSNIYRHAKKLGVGPLLNMLNVGRITAFIGYPLEIEYATRTTQETQDVKWFPLSVTPKYTMAYIACSKTEWGKQFVQRLNFVITSPEFMELVNRTSLSWLPENERKQFQADLTVFFETRQVQ